MSTLIWFDHNALLLLYIIFGFFSRSFEQRVIICRLFTIQQRIFVQFSQTTERSVCRKVQSFRWYGLGREDVRFMGFVKLNTNLKSWAWINEPKTVYVYIRLLLGAAWADTDVGNVHLRRGEIVISQRDFAEQCSVTRQELRTAISRLIAPHRITQRTERKYSIITLCDYDCETTVATQMSTRNQPDNNPIATQ